MNPVQRMRQRRSAAGIYRECPAPAVRLRCEECHDGTGLPLPRATHCQACGGTQIAYRRFCAWHLELRRARWRDYAERRRELRA